MAVDDDEPIVRLGDDVSPVHLRARRAERGGKVALIRRRGRRRRGDGELGEARLRRIIKARRRGRGAPVPAGRGRRRPERLRRAHGENRRRPAGARSAVQRFAQALLDCADDEAAQEAGIAETHLGLSRMHVDVDLARSAFDEEGDDRVPVGGQEIEVRPTQRARERLVAHGAAVDEEKLLARVRTAIGRQADPAQEPHALAARVDFERICGEVIPQRLAQPLGAARFAGP